MKTQKTFYDTNIILSGLKADIQKMENQLHKLERINAYKRELSGVIGVSEHTADYWVMFGEVSPIDKQEDFILEVKALFSDSQEVTIDTFPKDKLTDIFNRYITVIDNRETQEQRQQRDELIKQNEIQFKAKRDEQEQQINLGTDETITLPENKMFAVISAYHDNSDSMTDYYHPHALLSHNYVLATVNVQPKSERLARRCISNIPELQNLKWEWKTENWSMGNGNYLISEVVGKIQHSAYDGRNEVNYWYEIHFEKYTKEMRKSKWYNKPLEVKSEVVGHSSTAKLVKNTEKQGIEVYFNEKPEQIIIDKLKACNFRWSFQNKCWYIKDTTYNQEYVNTMKQTLNLL